MGKILYYYPFIGKHIQNEYKIVSENIEYPEFHLKLSKNKMEDLLINLYYNNKHNELFMFYKIYNTIFLNNYSYNYVEIFSFN